MEEIDLEYLCTNLGNLSGIPVRLYENRELTFKYSIIYLPFDPFKNMKKKY